MSKKSSDLNTLTEAANLTRLFARVGNRARFARDHRLPGGQAVIYQHMKGLRPISLEAAIAYAAGLGCSLEEISPRWARLIRQANQYCSSNLTGEAHSLAVPTPTLWRDYNRSSAARRAVVQCILRQPDTPRELDILHDTVDGVIHSAEKLLSRRRKRPSD